MQPKSMFMDTRVLDGSVLEGGGQIMRNAVAFSALLREPITVIKIRQNRQPQGLKPQHLAGLQLTAGISSAELHGGVNGSGSIFFNPGPIQLGKSYIADPGTAGSTTLLLQAALPLLLFSPPNVASNKPRNTITELLLRGGTNAIQAPQVDYTKQILLPFLQRHLGLDMQLDILRRGYYPKGGGEVRVRVPPAPGQLPAFTLTERGHLRSISGRAYVAGLPRRRAEHMQRVALDRLVSSGIPRDIIDITVVREREDIAFGRASGIVLWADTENGCRLAGSAVGIPGKDVADTANEAATELIQNLNHGGCVDEYLQDQMIIFLALAAGRSLVRTGPLSLHTRTAIWIAEQMTNARFETREVEGTQTVLLSCEGIGYTAGAPAPGIDDTSDCTS